jgi:hypothetical protein
MSAFKLHHTKFYTKHSDAETGKCHCYRCNELLELGAKVPLTLKHGQFALGASNDGELVYMGSLCALKAIAGK